MKCAEHCAELYQRGFTTSGVYRIAPSPKVWFEVWCDQETDGGGWTVIQRRLNGEVSFDRDWKTYKGKNHFLEFGINFIFKMVLEIFAEITGLVYKTCI